MNKLDLILDQVEELDIESRELLLDILHKRLLELRRSEISNHAAEADQEYKTGNIFKGNADEVIKKLNEEDE